MLLQALYDFTPRGEDNNKTLAFRQHDILMFLEVYPKDENWLQVANRLGHIGYIPRNYVQINDDIGRDAVLEFLLAATMRARRDTLDTIETLENLKDHVVRIEYREFQTRLLRKALDFRKDEPEFEIEDDNSYTGEDFQGQADSSHRSGRSYSNGPYQVDNYKIEEQKTSVVNRCDSNSSFCTPTSERSHAQSIKSAPANSRTKTLTRKNVTTGEFGTDTKKTFTPYEQPVCGRPSKSCPLGTKSNSTGKFSVACSTELDQNGSGDNIAAQASNQSIITGYNHNVKSSRNDSSKTRIPVRTLKNKPLESGRTYTCDNSTGTGTSSNVRRFSNNNSDWESMTARLVKIVQESGGLNMKQSEVVVHRILHHINENYHPDMPEKVGSVLRVLERSPTSDSLHLGTETSKKLRELLKFLANLGKQSVLEDVASIEDESVISEKLDQLLSELVNHDPKEIKHIMESDMYNSIHDLVLLYQSDGRILVKSKLLEVFSMIATMDSEGRSVLLRSILPIELAREMCENEGSSKRLSCIVNTLISLMSSGERLPETHYDHLGTKFLTFILNILDESGQYEIDEKAKADLMNLLLAYNLQFTPKDENLLIKTLAGRTPGRYFIETMIYLFEKETDPIKGGGQCLDSVPHSVFKLMKDMFSSKMTAEHFHSAELKVLTDSLIQSLVDLKPGDNRRTDYLEIIWLIFRNSTFRYRISDQRECLVGILLEEDPLSIPDQRIVKAISKEFPSVFAKGSRERVKSKHRFEDDDKKMPF